MPYRTITLSEEAYQALKRRKKQGESFTELVLREFAGQGSADHILSVLKTLQFPEDFADSAKKTRTELRKNFRMREFD
jgi:predicted CopG family antitoxin